MGLQVLRVFVVDDSSLYRKVISDAIQGLEGVRLSGFARDGREALEKIEILRPDVVTLDVEMPVMNGIEALAVINERWPNIKVVMVSSMSDFSVRQTIEAVEGNAFSFIMKPESGDNIRIKSDLVAVFDAIVAKQVTASTRSTLPIQPIRYTSRLTITPPLVGVIGISTGGPNALAQVIPQLPVDLKIPICIVQHMPAGFTRALADSLNNRSRIRVKEAANNEKLEAGTVYIAPGGKHMRIATSPDSLFGRVEITDDAPENFCKPSVDYLLRSLSLAFPGKVITMIMTGMGQDGTRGLQLVKRHGGIAIGQDEASCTVYGMPGAAMQAGLIDIEVPLNDIVPTFLTYL